MIIVPVCNRTNYSKIKPILKLMPVNSFQIILSSSILLEKYGNAYKDIINDNFPIVETVDCVMANDSLDSYNKLVGLSQIQHSSIYKRLDPEAVLIVGDRIDMLPAATAARIMNIPICHIQGGERSGSIDDYIRDIISVCSDRHYVATENSKINVEKIAHSKSVFNFGCPAVEEILKIKIHDNITDSNLHKKFKNSIKISKNEKFLLILVHPNTTEEDDINMDDLLLGISTFNMKKILLYPNVDAFHENIIKSIRVYEKQLILIKHAPLEDFVNIMAHSSCMIGNSSSGIREAASFGVPVVNIGNRQKNRERNKNTIDTPSDKDSIIKAIEKSLNIERYPIDNIYYKPNCAENIVKDISSVFFVSSNTPR